jgi:hypothetical protein
MLPTAISCDARRYTRPSVRLVGEKKGSFLHDVTLHPEALVFLPSPLQFFLSGGEATVPWKGMRSLLLQVPFPLPQHSGMQAQITRGFTHTIAVMGDQRHRFAFALGRVNLPFR